ncbi:MAG: hypothetical protein K2I14_02050 [Eubacterium sp.]|nr:hypothetical protein [Eubacterium sp.]
MKKSRIQNICIHRVNISQEAQKEILEKLTYYHTKTIKQKLDNTNLSAKDKLKILSDK